MTDIPYYESNRLSQLIDSIKTAKDIKFSFLIGAGASVSSGIPSGGELAERWLEELRFVLGDDFDAWSQQEGIDDGQGYGAHYSTIYDKLFECCPQLGCEAIKEYIEGKYPSVGYLIMAHLLTKTRHSTVITTNFDTLLEDAILTLMNKKPFVAGHESLASFVKTHSDRPTILKLHRDVLLEPKSRPEEIKQLAEPWRSALDYILGDNCHLIVIGYGGNDDSLMSYLQNEETPRPDKIYWCRRRGDPLPPKAKELLRDQDSEIEIESFDQFMVNCYEAFEWQFLEGIERLSSEDILPHSLLAPVHDRLLQVKRTTDRLMMEKIQGKVSHTSALPTKYYKYVENILQKTDPSERKSLFEEGLSRFNNVASFYSIYASYLHDHEGDERTPKSLYKRSLEIDPNNADTLGDYAVFLHQTGQEKEAYDYYNRALKADPDHGTNLGNYALFLADVRQEYEGAKESYQRAIKTDPSNSNILGNYAVLLERLQEMDQAEEYYQQAVRKDPRHAGHLGNYANFLKNVRQDRDKAREYYRKALEKDCNHASNLGNYALFLQESKEYDDAQRHYEQALEVAPYHFINLSNYAAFLMEICRDYDKAKEYLERALEINSNHADNLFNYAVLLNHLGDYDKAKGCLERALEVAPGDAEALELLRRCRDHQGSVAKT